MSRDHLPEGRICLLSPCVLKLSDAFNHSILIALELTIWLPLVSRRFLIKRTMKTFPYNQIAKKES